MCGVHLFTAPGYGIDLRTVEENVAPRAQPMCDALMTASVVVSEASGSSLALMAVVLVLFCFAHYIEAHRKELGILRALGHSTREISRSFWIFGLSALMGCAFGHALAAMLAPELYAAQNDGNPFDVFDPSFYPLQLLCLVILPAVVFAAFSVACAARRRKTPVMRLLRGRSVTNEAKRVTKPALSFPQDMRRAAAHGRGSSSSSLALQPSAMTP